VKKGKEKNSFFIIESWLWIFIFLLFPLYGLLRTLATVDTFDTEPWFTITTFLLYSLIPIAILIKIVKMLYFNKYKRGVIYILLFFAATIFLWTPWQNVLF